MEKRLDERKSKPALRCLIRDKWIAPRLEELVRQLWLEHLHRFYGYPLARLAVEVSITFGRDTGAPLALWSNGTAPVVGHRKNPNYFVEIPDLPTATQTIEAIAGQPWTIDTLMEKEEERNKDGLLARSRRLAILRAAVGHRSLREDAQSAGARDAHRHRLRLRRLRLPKRRGYSRLKKSRSGANAAFSHGRKPRAAATPT